MELKVIFQTHCNNYNENYYTFTYYFCVLLAIFYVAKLSWNDLYHTYAVTYHSVQHEFNVTHTLQLHQLMMKIFTSWHHHFYSVLWWQSEVIEMIHILQSYTAINQKMCICDCQRKLVLSTLNTPMQLYYCCISPLLYVLHKI